MNQLNPSELSSYINSKEIIEQFICSFETNEHQCFRWIEIRKDKQKFTLILHEVFDDRDERIESIYDFSYLEADEMDGSEIYESNSLDEIINFASEKYSAVLTKYSPFGYLNDWIKNSTQQGV